MLALKLLPLAGPVVNAWARSRQADIQRHGWPLSAAQQSIAAHVGVAQPALVRIAVVDTIPFPLASLLQTLARWTRLPGPSETHGLTLGHTIYLRADAAHSAELLAHECRHVQQCDAAGSLEAFMALYLQQVAEHGYHDAPLEVDARRAAYAWRLAQQGRATAAAPGLGATAPPMHPKSWPPAC